MSTLVGFMVGVQVVCGVVVSPVFKASQHPSNNKIGLEKCGNGATRSAYPSFWPGGEELFYW
jgi:hypothetical protein